jgi:hypothetical protein
VLWVVEINSAFVRQFFKSNTKDGGDDHESHDEEGKTSERVDGTLCDEIEAVRHHKTGNYEKDCPVSQGVVWGLGGSGNWEWEFLSRD